MTRRFVLLALWNTVASIAIGLAAYLYMLTQPTLCSPQNGHEAFAVIIYKDGLRECLYPVKVGV